MWKVPFASEDNVIIGLDLGMCGWPLYLRRHLPGLVRRPRVPGTETCLLVQDVDTLASLLLPEGWAPPNSFCVFLAAGPQCFEGVGGGLVVVDLATNSQLPSQISVHPRIFLKCRTPFDPHNYLWNGNYYHQLVLRCREVKQCATYLSCNVVNGCWCETGLDSNPDLTLWLCAYYCTSLSLSFSIGKYPFTVVSIKWS